MERFYFDINDGRSRSIDEDGQDLESLAQAREAAMQELTLIIRDELPDGNRAAYVITVRDDAGIPVIVATATMLCETLHGA